MMYECAKIVMGAIQECQSVDGAAIRDAMANISIDLPTGHLTFDENRNPVKACVIIELVDGKRVYKDSVSAE